MLEKEAEEYVLQQSSWCASECGVLRDAFKEGAEFGFNKGKNQAKEILAKLLEEENNNMYWEMNG